MYTDHVRSRVPVSGLVGTSVPGRCVFTSSLCPTFVCLFLLLKALTFHCVSFIVPYPDRPHPVRGNLTDLPLCGRYRLLPSGCP